jgi:hypothetical protein
MKTSHLFTAAACCALAIFLGSRLASAIVIASDNASDPAYADGWSAGDNGGFGFEPWTGSGPIMEIDETPAEPDNHLGTPAFRFGNTGPFEQYFFERIITNPIQAGQSFSIDYDSYPITEPGMPRDILIRFSSAGGERLALYGYYYNDGPNVFNYDNWDIYAATANDNLAGGASLPDGDLSGVQWKTPYTTSDGSDGFSLTLDIVTIDTYRLRIFDDSVTRLDISGQLLSPAAVVGQGINKLSFYGSETSQQFPDIGGIAYLNNLKVETTPGLPGDYNGNGTVDAADYVVWRNGDSPDDTVAGYNLWRANFGKPLGSGLGSTAAVPEPATMLPVAAGVVLLLATGRTRACAALRRG